MIQKTRLGDLNISNDGETFDWRISVSVETPCE